MAGDKKVEALKTILRASLQYNELVGKDFLFLFGNDKNYRHIQVRFPQTAFLHLTGVRLSNEKINASLFFNKCISNKLSIRDFDIENNGLVALKLQVLENALKIGKTSKMIGEYDGKGPLLQTEKLAGGERACMGFKLVQSFYVPNTLINGDIRTLVKKFERIISILHKSQNEEYYSKILYQAKGINISLMPEVLGIHSKIKVCQIDEEIPVGFNDIENMSEQPIAAYVT